METIFAILIITAFIGVCASVCFSMFMFFTVPSVFAIILAYACGGPIWGTVITIPILLFWISGMRAAFSDWKFDRLYKQAERNQHSNT